MLLAIHTGWVGLDKLDSSPKAYVKQMAASPRWFTGTSITFSFTNRRQVNNHSCSRLRVKTLAINQDAICASRPLPLSRQCLAAGLMAMYTLPMGRFPSFIGHEAATSTGIKPFEAVRRRPVVVISAFNFRLTAAHVKPTVRVKG